MDAHDAKKIIAKAISGAPFASKRSLSRAAAVLAALEDAGIVLTQEVVNANGKVIGHVPLESPPDVRDATRGEREP